MAGFEWDPAKAAENDRKHGVTFDEAATVLDDPEAVVREDEEHSDLEERFHVIGRSAAHRLVAVTYTMRDENTRFITARPATPEEIKDYDRNANR